MNRRFPPVRLLHVGAIAVVITTIALQFVAPRSRAEQRTSPSQVTLDSVVKFIEAETTGTVQFMTGSESVEHAKQSLDVPAGSGPMNTLAAAEGILNANGFELWREKSYPARPSFRLWSYESSKTPPRGTAIPVKAGEYTLKQLVVLIDQATPSQILRSPALAELEKSAQTIRLLSDVPHFTSLIGSNLLALHGYRFREKKIDGEWAFEVDRGSVSMVDAGSVAIIDLQFLPAERLAIRINTLLRTANYPSTDVKAVQNHRYGDTLILYGEEKMLANLSAMIELLDQKPGSKPAG